MPAYQYGWLVETSFRWAIPSAFVTKPEFYPETLILQLCGIQVNDDSVSIPTILLADFGPVGVLLAGFCTSIFLYFIARGLAKKRDFDLISVYLLGFFYNQSLRIESELLFSLLFFRDIFVIFLLSLIWRCSLAVFSIISRPHTIRS
jgi:hypothetical protein